MKASRFGAGLILASAFVIPAVGQAAIIFDNSSVANSFAGTRPAGSSPVAVITVSSATTIDQIGALVDLASNGNLKFVIFDNATGTLLFSTAAQAFVDDGATFKLSNVFAGFVLNPGTTYGIGAIADVGGSWSATATPTTPYTQNGITAATINGNVSGFTTPSYGANSSAMVAIELGASPRVAVPEPETLGLVGLGVLALGLARRRRTR